MAKQKAGLLRAALVIGGTAVAAFLSKKENRDRLMEEYNKAKQDPQGYKDQVSEKANQFTQTAKEEINKVKEDPQGYTGNVADKVKEKAQPLMDKVKNDDVERFPKTQENTKEQVATFDDEGGASNIHIVTDKNHVTDNNPDAVNKDDLKK